jgi:hypothetical protein
MAKRLTLVLAVAVVFLLAAGAVWGDKYDPAKTNMVPRLTGAEFPDYLMTGARGVFWDQFCDEDTILSPWDTVMSCTFYDYQANSRIPHMNARDYQDKTILGLHFTYMEGEATPPANRWVDYNYRSEIGGWLYDYNEDEMHMTKTIAIAGYTGLDVFRPLTGYPKTANRVVICHHWTTELPGQDTEMFCVLSIEPSLAGTGAMSKGSYYYDIPDMIEGDEEVNAMWPACAIDSLNRIHVVGCEQEEATGAIQDFGYIRCEEIFAGTSGDSIMCQAPGKTAVRIKKETYYSDEGWEMSTFGRGGTISPMACASKVSNKVALVWMNLAASEPDSDVSQLSNDVMYIESKTGGDDWFSSGTWPVTPINVTQYDSSDMMRGYGEVTPLYDMDDSLHIFWVTHGYNMAEGTYDYTDVTLWHWSKATVRICGTDTFPANQVSAAKWTVDGGAWNWTQTKLTGGVGILPDTNYNYLYLQWTQFDSLNYDSTFENQSDGGNAQGDIYISVSTDAGKTWNRPYNVTKSSVQDCAAGDCASEHWSSMAERVDNFVYQQWIYDIDAGGIPQDEGTGTDNPVIFHQLPIDSVPIADEARIAWNPAEWVDPPIHIMKNGNAQVELLLENTGTKNLNISTISSDAGWMGVNPTSADIVAGGCPQKVTVSISGVNADTFLVGNITVTSNDDVGNDNLQIRVHVVESNDYKSAEFVVLENPTYQLSVSNTGNEAHQEGDAGFFLKEDVNEPNYLYDGSPIVGWIEVDSDTLVGRYIFNEHYMVPATDIYVDTNSNLNTIVAETESWPARIQIPPADQDWPYWRLKTKVYIFFSDDSSVGHPEVDNKNEQYIALKSLKLFHDAPPAWWVDVTPPASIPETYLGMALDIDCPTDSGSSINYPGDESTRRAMYIQGFGGVNENYKMAIGQRDTCYEFAPDSFKCWPAPYTLDTKDEWGMHVLRNDSTVYPQSGYADPELYGYMATSGYSIQGDLSEADYNIVASGAKISGHSYPSDAVWGVTYVQAVSDRYEIEHLDTLIDMCMCGNVNRDDGVSVTDVVFMIAYVLKGTGPRIWSYMGDATGDGYTTIADISYMINYLFKNGRPPMCSYL